MSHFSNKIFRWVLFVSNENLMKKEIVPNSRLEFDCGDYRWYFVYTDFDECIILKKVKIKDKERI